MKIGADEVWEITMIAHNGEPFSDELVAALDRYRAQCELLNVHRPDPNTCTVLLRALSDNESVLHHPNGLARCIAATKER